MEKTLKQVVLKFSKEGAFVLFTVCMAVLLPQLFHVGGKLLGVGAALGQIFLPMYLPVLILGCYRGAATGAVAGLLSPIVSYFFTQMPALAMLPYITAELVALGFFAGVFSKTKLPALLRVFLAQVVAKAVRIALFGAVLAANGAFRAPALFAGIGISLPGVALQLIVVTLLILYKEKNKNA